MTRSMQTFGWALAGLAVLALAAPSGLDAQTIRREPARQIDSVEGADLYKAYCASCHGTEGRGDGPAALALKSHPGDLRLLAKKHGGTFSHADVEAAITGKGTLLASHGSADMPVWGPIFSALSSGDQAMKTLRITNLVKYIEAMQQK